MPEYQYQSVFSQWYFWVMVLLSIGSIIVAGWRINKSLPVIVRFEVKPSSQEQFVTIPEVNHKKGAFPILKIYNSKDEWVLFNSEKISQNGDIELGYVYNQQTPEFFRVVIK